MGDHVFLNVMLKKGVVRFGKRGKLSPRYIGPFEVLERVGTVAFDWLYRQVYLVFMRYSMSSCSRSTPQIRLM